MFDKAIGIINGKIYVIGDCWGDDKVSGNMLWKRVMVFDTEIQMWEQSQTWSVLYFYDVHKNKLRAYDPKQRCWIDVTGLEELLPKTACTDTVSYGGKLALFFRNNGDAQKIWCAEIALERCQGGEILGKVQWCDVVTDDGNFHMVKCLTVTV
ncbi:F-box/kelch-repeat protein At4g38940 [Eutrema salsugineum]|nr:F-box/kelch-repeat protein At4g38940 [Eutrema salsugineum]